MGLGLRAIARPSPGQEFFDLNAVALIAREHLSEHGLQDFCRETRRNSAAYLSFHPAAEDVEFKILESGTLIVSSKTSGVGPGYHQFVVELLDRLGTKLGIGWQWTQDEKSDEASFDETGYAILRDFDELSAEMNGWLRDLSSMIVERSREGNGLLINMPMDSGVEPGAEIATPVGPLPVTFFERVVQDASYGPSAGREFFPWFESGLTASTWKNLGNALLWMSICWHEPRNDNERDEIERALLCFDRARALDPKISTPDEEIRQLRLLLSGEDIGPPAEIGLGYQRRHCRRQLTGGWSLLVPGYFYDEARDEGTTVVCWFREREVWGSSWSISPPKSPSLDGLKQKTSTPSWTIEHFDIAGCAEIRRKDSDEGSYLSISCRFDASGSTAIITIIVPGEPDLPWARQVFESIRFSPERLQ